MALPPEQAARISGRLNLELMATQLVVIVGIGTVGSQVSLELANAYVGRQRLIDHDQLEPANLPRHALKDRRYLNMNKAEAMTLYLADVIGTTRPEAVPLAIDESLSDYELDELLADADLIIAATGDPATQRRLGERALALDIPALFPALGEGTGGEIFVQLGPSLPCFFCWQGFRQENAGLHGVEGLNVDAALYIVGFTTQLALGTLDNDSTYAERLNPEPGEPRPQLFVWTGEQLAPKPAPWCEDCPVCGGPLEYTRDQSRTLSSLEPEQRPNLRVLYAFLAALAVIAIIMLSVDGSSPKRVTPTSTASSKSASTSTTAGEVTNEASTPETGTSIATAFTIEPGVEENGNSGTVAYGEGSCGPEEGQFWQATLYEGEVATIVWGGQSGSAMGLDIWPPGTTEVHGSGEGRVTYASTEGEDTETTFTAPTTGVYPIVIDDSCGQPGKFHFRLTTH
jgi:hypothetical protein